MYMLKECLSICYIVKLFAGNRVCDSPQKKDLNSSSFFRRAFLQVMTLQWLFLAFFFTTRVERKATKYNRTAVHNYLMSDLCPFPKQHYHFCGVNDIPSWVCMQMKYSGECFWTPSSFSNWTYAIALLNKCTDWLINPISGFISLFCISLSVY